MTPGKDVKVSLAGITNSPSVEAPVLVIEVAGTPSPQGSKSFKGFRAGKPVLVESCADLPHWREAIVAARKAAMLSGTATITTPVAVSIDFDLRRPPSAPKHRTVPDRRPDLDRLVRAVLDALTTADAIEDDARVVELVAWKQLRRRMDRRRHHAVGMGASRRACDGHLIIRWEAETYDATVKLSNDDLRTIGTVASALIAFLAFIIATISLRTSRRSYRLSATQYEERGKLREVSISFQFPPNDDDVCLKVTAASGPEAVYVVGIVIELTLATWNGDEAHRPFFKKRYDTTWLDQDSFPVLGITGPSIPDDGLLIPARGRAVWYLPYVRPGNNHALYMSWTIETASGNAVSNLFTSGYNANRVVLVNGGHHLKRPFITGFQTHHRLLARIHKADDLRNWMRDQDLYNWIVKHQGSV